MKTFFTASIKNIYIFKPGGVKKIVILHWNLNSEQNKNTIYLQQCASGIVMKLQRSGPHIGPCSLQTGPWSAGCSPEEQEESRKSSETKVHVAQSGCPGWWSCCCAFVVRSDGVLLLTNRWHHAQGFPGHPQVSSSWVHSWTHAPGGGSE